MKGLDSEERGKGLHRKKEAQMVVVLFSEEKVHTVGVWDVGWFEVACFKG